MKRAVVSVALLVGVLASASACAPASGSSSDEAGVIAMDPATLKESLGRAMKLFSNPGSSNPLQSLDDLNYGIRSGLLASTVASGTCICQFVEGLDPKACLDRVELQQKADLLTEISIDDSTRTVTVQPNGLARFLVWGGGPRAVAQFDREHPEFGCTLLEAGGKK